MVAVGNELHYSENFKTFPDFLGSYLASLMNAQWGSAQVALDLEVQHPIAQWHTLIAHDNMKRGPGLSGLFCSQIGAAQSWFRLAYDLYLIRHNATLQSKLLKRLRSRDHFQGARFEIAVAAMMVVAGFEITWADERGPGQHPEFIATSRDGHVIAVEAKSRHRPGVLGQPGQQVEPESAGIGGLLRAALAKETSVPLLAFIDINMPLSFDAACDSTVLRELYDTWLGAQERYRESTSPRLGVVYLNDGTPWRLSETIAERLTWVSGWWAEPPVHGVDCRALFQRILTAVGQRLNVPDDFPQDE